MGYWSFDTVNGPLVPDQSGRNHPGTIYGTPQPVHNAWSGTGLHFDGADDYVSVAYSADLAPSGGFTMMAWVNPETIPANRNTRLIEREGVWVLQPDKIKIEENRYFWPDLIASKDGETCYLEVESGQKEDRASAIRKRENALVVGGGRIYLVARKVGTMNSIQSQIVHWATENGKKCCLYATNLEMLGSIKPGESPWVRIREL